MQKNPDRDAKIFELWNTGMTSGDIGRELGVTRNIVMGVVHRAQKRGENLMQHEPKIPQNVKVTQPVKAKAVVRKAESGRTVVVARPRPMARDFEKLFPVTKSVKGGVGILDLGLFSCRYIVEGTGMNAVYCGKRTTKRTYCDEHHTLCYTPIQPKKKGRLNPLPA